MIKIGVMEFHRGVFWDNQFNTAQIMEEEFFDVDGGVSHQFMVVGDIGRTISLVAAGSDTGGRGMFTQAEIDYIKSLELSQDVVDFVYGGFTKKIRVPANPFSSSVPLRKMYGHTADDIYYGALTLREVV